MRNCGTATVPEVGVEFELTLDGDATDPIGMLRFDGIDPKGWKYDGTRVRGPQTRRFKLVQVGYQPNLDAVRIALAQHGKVREGQWREAFKATYPTRNEEEPIGFADPSWVLSGVGRCFPCLGVDGTRWGSNFRYAYQVHGDLWRWLVACK